MKKAQHVKPMLVASVLVGMLAACGSTLQTSATGQVPGGVGATSAADGGLTSAGTGTASTGTPTASTGTTTASTGTPSAPSGDGLGTSPGSTADHGSGSQGGGVAGQPAPGSKGNTGTGPVSSKTAIRVGVIYTSGLPAAASSIGVSGLSTGDTEAQAQAVFKWVNAHGGLAGHPIQGYYYAISETSSSADEAYQAACTALTQDDKVRYVVDILELDQDALACFAHAGVGVLDDESGLSDTTMAQYAAYLAGPGDIGTGRMITNLVNDLWKRGWLTPKSKVGSLTYDTPEYAAVVNGPLTQALRAHGLTIASKEAVDVGDSSVSQAPSVELQFRAKQVDRIIPIVVSPLFEMEDASSQGYHPEYAMYSSLSPALIEANAPKDQLVNSAGIGWQPFLDIGAGTHPGPVSSNQTLCLTLMKAAGQSSSSAETEGLEVQVCNVIFYLKFAADALRSVPSDLLSASRPRIGSSFKSADTFRTDVAHRPDGVAGYRDLLYETSCSCYQYVSAAKAAS